MQTKIAIILLLAITGVFGNSFINKYSDDILKYQHIDQNTYSNFAHVKNTHYDVDFEIDFESQQIMGNTTMNFTTSMETDQVNLDVYKLDISRVWNWEGKEIDFRIEEKLSDILGDQLQIPLNKTFPKNEKFHLTVEFKMTNKSTAVSWLTKEQTSSKTLPYLFTQCEPSYCRSILPLQDTPSIKSTFNAKVTLKDPINVFISGNLTGSHPHPSRKNYTVHEFSMERPIPSYLFSIVAGNVVEQEVGPRSYVISEPTEIEFYSEELSELETYLDAVENYTQIEYAWGAYKIVILPPSFPFGGMENPLLTFASPSIIVGDKSGTTVAIHEIAHSWTGNTVTCANWRNMWLNEGFTVFLERKAGRALNGDDFYFIEALNGNDTMADDFQNFGPTSNYSSLRPAVAGVNPDDSFSTIPYEKGFQFLTYMDNLFIDCNQTDFMQNMLTNWINKKSWKSADYTEFRAHVNSEVKANLSEANQTYIMDKVNWTYWIDTPGFPLDANLTFYTPVVNETQSLAAEYIKLGGKKSPANFKEYLEWFPNEKFLFLQYLYDHVDDVNAKIMTKIDDDLDVSGEKNKEILWRWYRVCIMAGYEKPMEEIEQFVGAIGRRKMIMPVYQALVAKDMTDLGIKWYKEFKDFYHPIARNSIEQLLGISSVSYELE